MNLQFKLATLLVVTILSTTQLSAQKLSRREREQLELQQKIDQAVEIEIARRDSVKQADRVRRKAEAEAIAFNEIETNNRLWNNDSLTINFSINQIDSLVEQWREWQVMGQYDSLFFKYDSAADDTSYTHIDTMYAKRLFDIASPIETPYNSIVRSAINRYINPRYTPIPYVLSRAQYYIPFFEDELMRQGLPIELRMLPVVESAINPTAISKAGAAGLWQFMPSTGKIYGLEVDYLVDERMDPIRSTEAACRFLKDLYGIYNNWPLAIAAYNCGPGNVNKAIARSGMKNGSFWDVYNYLPNETRGYVPALIGATYAYTYHKQHGIEPRERPLTLATDTINISRIMHLGQVAEVIDIPISVLRTLNPQYRRDIIPATTREYSLRLPQRYVTEFINNQEAIYAKDADYLKQYINPANIDKARQYPMGLTHTVRSGDTLSGLAVKYHTTIRQIMIWNKLKSADKLRIGQKLRVGSN